MGRRPLQPGEQGALTVTRVTKTPTGWLNNPQGDMWSARIRVGQHGKAAKEIRRIAPTRKAAETACREAADIETILTQAGPTGDLEWQTVYNLWDTYKASPSFLDRLKPSTQENHEGIIRRSIEDNPTWWNTPCIEAYQRANLEPLVAEYAHNRGTEAAETLTNILRAMAKYSSQEVETLARARITIPHARSQNRQLRQRDKNYTLTRSELADVQQKLLAGKLGQARMVLLLMTYTGGRVTDTWNVSKTDINWASGEIKMTSMKTGKPYPTKTLPQTILDKLRAYADTQPGDTLFNMGPSAGTRSQQISRLLARLGYPEATAHTIRRTVGSLIFDAYGLRAASEWLAHNSVQITMQWYVKVDGAAPSFAPVLDLKPEIHTGNSPL